MKRKTSNPPFLGLLVVAAVISLGTYWSFARGGNDFQVFYYAARLVSEHRAPTIYFDSPDRFLYAPGFAWLMWPLALLPKALALSLWCLLKAFAIGLAVSALGLPAGLWGVALCARPLLIDFQYGQINALILGLGTWTLVQYFKRGGRSSQLRFTEWFVLGILSATKLFPAPMLLVPWFVGAARTNKVERWAGALGFLFVLALPLTTLSFQEWFTLHLQWKDALLLKGLPTDSHNQSLAAFMFHYLSDTATHVIGAGAEPLKLGNGLLSSAQIMVVAKAWTLMVVSFLLGWVALAARRRSPLDFVAVILGLLIVPSHIIWKPYFLFAIPLASQVVKRRMADQTPTWNNKTVLLFLLFLVFNFASLDFVGPKWNAILESASILFWAHLILIGWVVFGSDSLLEAGASSSPRGRAGRLESA